MDEQTFDPVDAIGLLRSYSRHRDFVRLALMRVGQCIEQRAVVHDASKMLDDEFAGFSRINRAARVHKFGSPEYAEGMRSEKAVIDLHFSRNSHHPEPDVEKPPLNFIDVIEMVCDWWGAGKGYDSPLSWKDSFEKNMTIKDHHLTPEQRWLAKQVYGLLLRLE